MIFFPFVKRFSRFLLKFIPVMIIRHLQEIKNFSFFLSTSLPLSSSISSVTRLLTISNSKWPCRFLLFHSWFANGNDNEFPPPKIHCAHAQSESGCSSFNGWKACLKDAYQSVAKKACGKSLPSRSFSLCALCRRSNHVFCVRENTGNKSRDSKYRT